MQALRCRPTLFKETSTQVFFCDYREIFTKIFFDRKPPVASVDLLLLNKSNVGWFLLKRVELFYSVFYTLLVETIPTRFYWLNCRNQKLAQSKTLEQRLFVLKLGFWQCKQDFCRNVYFNDIQINMWLHLSSGL